MKKIFMKHIFLRMLPLFAAATALLGGCSEKHVLSGPSSVTLRLEVPGLERRADENAVENLTGYIFSDGTLRETVRPQNAGADGLYSFTPENASGTLYLVANVSGETLSSVLPGMSESDFLAVEEDLDDLVSDKIVMTARADMSSASGGVLPVRMVRSAARVDVVVEDKGVTVKKVVLNGVADRGYINAGPSVRTPESASFVAVAEEFSLTNASATVCWLAEQKNDALTAEVTVEIGGIRHNLRAALPSEIRRNRHYTIRVHGSGTSLSVSVGAEDWESGGSSDSAPVLKGLVDKENSVLPDGVEVNAAGDTVFVGHYETSFELVLLAEPGASAEVEGKVDGVYVEVLPVSRHSLVRAASLSVTGITRLPGRPEEKIHVEIYEGNTYSGRIVIVFRPNPAEFSGMLVLDGEGVCDFGRYVDGELGVVSLPSGMVLSLDFDKEESKWMKVEESVSEDGKRTLYTVFAGWKPNDPKADGRVQEGRIVISEENGKNAESYPVRRRNWGLPVVEIAGTWWTKYNLRGNVKEFSDQITVDKDPAADGDLLAFLSAADESMLLELMGDQYQAGNTQGLPLRHDGTSFYYEGMQAYAENFGLLSPDQMAPDGYRIPDYENFAFLTANDNFNLGDAGSRQYENRYGQTLGITIEERTVDFLGHRYGNVSFYDFEYGGNHWVLYGLGHQWSTTPGNVAVRTLLLATYGSAGNSWELNGMQSGENRLRFAANNTTKTRMIRCIKSPVEYIYD